jgi:hypothetical protein
MAGYKCLSFVDVQTRLPGIVESRSPDIQLRSALSGFQLGELPYLPSAERLATGRDFSAVVSCESTARHPRGLPEAAAFPKRDT